MEKAIKDIKVGDCRIDNPDYDFLWVQFFDKVDFANRRMTSKGVRAFGNGSSTGNASYMVKPSDAENTIWKLNIVSDGDTNILRKAYDEFVESCTELYDDAWNVNGEPLYYASDTELNLPVKDGDILMQRNAKYPDNIELLVVAPNDYGDTIEKDLAQEEDCLKWLSRDNSRHMRVVLHGRKIILSKNSCQYQTKNALLICNIGAAEHELYRVNVDMADLAGEIEELNSKFYEVAKYIFEKNGGILKEESIKKDW